MKAFLLCCFMAIINCKVQGQIKLPSKYKCSGSTTGTAFYTDGKIRINSLNFFDDTTSFVRWLTHEKVTARTADGIFYSTGYKNGYYFHILAMPHATSVIAFVSRQNNKDYKDFHAWILAQIRLYLKDKMPIKIYNSKGATCA